MPASHFFEERNVKHWAAFAALAVLSGCVTPRSMTLGEMAAPMGKGGAEVGTFIGVPYAYQANPTTVTEDIAGNRFNNQVVGKALAVPGAEANLQYGFSDRFALNVHASSAGLQPGLKWTLNKSRIFHFTLQPAAAFGFGRYDASTLQAGQDGRYTEVNPTQNTTFTLMTGLKVLFSHRSGFYAGVGYDFLLNRQYSAIPATTGSGAQETAATAFQHQIMAAVGLDIPIGQGHIHLRPEIAFAAVPMYSIASTTTVSGANPVNVNSTGGYAFIVMPGFTLAIASPAPPRSEEDDSAEEAPAKNGDDEDKASGDDNDDEDDKPQKRRPKKRSEDEENTSRRRSPPREDQEE